MSTVVTEQPRTEPPASPAGPAGPADDAARLVQRLWAEPAVARRGPKAGLSVDRITHAAVAIADEHGIDAVTMARVGKTLGVSPMALYRHVSGKDELLARLADHVALDLPDIPTGTDWRTGLELWMRAQIDMAITRPWFLDLPLTTLLPGPRRLRWLDVAFGLMEGLPLTADEKFTLVGMLALHVLGEARIQVESRHADGNPYEDLEMLLQHYASPADYPHLYGAVAGWAPPAEPAEPKIDDVGFGLRIVLDGVEAYVARQARRSLDDATGG